jgi:hypothetical protein
MGAPANNKSNQETLEEKKGVIFFITKKIL